MKQSTSLLDSSCHWNNDGLSPQQFR